MYSHTLHVELKCTVLEFDSKIIVIYVTHTSVEFLHAKCVSRCIEYMGYNMMRIFLIGCQGRNLNICPQCSASLKVSGAKNWFAI